MFCSSLSSRPEVAKRDLIGNYRLVPFGLVKPAKDKLYVPFARKICP